MIQEKTISILGKDVRMRYCAAAETGYEKMSGRTMEVFGKIGEATQQDYIYLAYASIIAAYSRNHQEPPVTAEDILFEVSPKEIIELIQSVIELRSAWYEIPAVMEEKVEEDDPKNV